MFIDSVLCVLFINFIRRSSRKYISDRRGHCPDKEMYLPSHIFLGIRKKQFDYTVRLPVSLCNLFVWTSDPDESGYSPCHLMQCFPPSLVQIG